MIFSRFHASDLTHRRLLRASINTCDIYCIISARKQVAWSAILQNCIFTKRYSSFRWWMHRCDSRQLQIYFIPRSGVNADDISLRQLHVNWISRAFRYVWNTSRASRRLTGSVFVRFLYPIDLFEVRGFLNFGSFDSWKKMLFRKKRNAHRWCLFCSFFSRWSVKTKRSNRLQINNIVVVALVVRKGWNLFLYPLS